MKKIIIGLITILIIVGIGYLITFIPIDIISGIGAIFLLMVISYFIGWIVGDLLDL